MLQQADSGEKNEKLVEKNCLFSRKAKERKWDIERLLLKGKSRGLETPWLVLSSALGHWHCKSREQIPEGQKWPFRFRNLNRNPSSWFWEKQGICSFIARWHKTCRIFIRVIWGLYIHGIQSKNSGSCQRKPPERSLGGQSGKPTLWSRALLRTYRFGIVRAHHLYSNVRLGRSVEQDGGRNPGTRLRREENTVYATVNFWEPCFWKKFLYPLYLNRWHFGLRCFYFSSFFRMYCCDDLIQFTFSNTFVA